MALCVSGEDVIFSKRRASENKRERDANDRRRFALRQAQALAALTARGLSVAEAEAMLAKGAPAPQESAPGGQVKAGAEVPGLERALETVTNKTLELAGPDLKIYPGLAAAALAEDDSLGLGYWLLVRALDMTTEPKEGAPAPADGPKGEGRILRAVLRAEALKHISRDKLKRAERQALIIGLVQFVRRRSDGAEVVSYASVTRAAGVLGVAHVGAYPVLVPAGKMRKAATWKAALWFAYHAGRAGKAGGVISRAELERKTGVPERTQRRYERRAGVKARANFELVPVNSRAEAERLKAWHAECGRTAFIGRGRFKSYLIVRHPNSYTVPGARLAKRGRVRNINSALSGGLLISARGQHDKEPRCRTHYDTREGAVQAVKRISEVLDEPPRVVYLNGWTKSGAANVWRRVAVV